jgi:hypothetical protein
MTLVDLVQRLESIAHKNHDAFEYRIEIRAVHGGVEYEFICEERADGHDFVAGVGSTIEAAVEKASHSIAGACESWRYSDPGANHGP